jgi:hypothetical protein
MAVELLDHEVEGTAILRVSGTIPNEMKHHMPEDMSLQ